MALAGPPPRPPRPPQPPGSSPPPSPPPSDGAALAEQLAERLLQNVRRSGPPSVLAASEIYTADVEASIGRFSVQWLWHARSQEPFPCLELGFGNPIPIDLIDTLLTIPPSGSSYQFAAFRGIETANWRRAFEDIFSLSVEVYDSDKVLGFMRSNLERFLTTRLSARRSNISQSPGLKYTVTTQTQNLRVHYSPAYFFTPSHVLGSPTTPVVSWIQPGRYLFGAGGGSIPLQFDLNATYDIPPSTQAQLYI